MLRGRTYVWFVKIFLLYIFFEQVLLNLYQSETYYLIIKFVGDLGIAVFLLFTVLTVRKFKFYKSQLVPYVMAFLLVALISTIANSLSLLDLYLGLRSLFRYYLVYFIAFYYDLGAKSVGDIGRFLVITFYVEFTVFIANYLLTGSTTVLGQTYLPQALYLNTVFAFVLYRYRFSLYSLFLSTFIAVQAFLSTSRLAVIGLLLQIAVYYAIFYKKAFSLKLVYGAIAACLLLLILSLPLIQGYLEETETYEKLKKTRLAADPDSNFRLYLASEFTALSIRTNNLIGDGPNTFGSQDFHRKYHYRLGFDDRTIRYAADSHYTILLMRYGFIGMFLYYFILYRLFKCSRAQYRALLMPYISFMVLASFALPVFSMRISSFFMFAIFGMVNQDGAS